MRKEGKAHRVVTEKEDLENLGRIIESADGHCSSGNGSR